MKWLRFCGFIGVFTCLLLEVGLRLTIGRVFPPRFFEPHAQFGHFHRANVSGWQRTSDYETYITINAKGLRGKEYPYEKAPDTHRILVIGDSFTEGLQVAEDKTFAVQLEQSFQSAGQAVEVINGGVSRYGTSETLLFLEGEGLKYQPDVVIYALYPNDITDNLTRQLFRLEAGQLVKLPMHISPWEAWRGRLYDVSYLYRVGMGVYLTLQQQRDATLISTDWGLVLPIYQPEFQTSEAWQLLAALLQRMAQDVETQAAQLMVVYLPEDIQVEDTQWQQVIHSNPTLERTAPNQAVAASISPNVMFIDLTAGFQAVAADQPLYYASDRHFTSAGHALVAQLLLPRLEQLLEAAKQD